MASPKLKQGSKGNLVTLLQKFLNLKGKLPKPIPEDGEFGSETKEAVRFFQKQAKLKTELDGAVGPETASALAKLIGPAAASFAKAFGELEDAGAKAGAAKEEKDKKNASDAPRTTAGAAGEPGKYGNVEYESGGYLISIPPDPAGKFPLLVLFAGDTKKRVMIDAALTVPNYFKKAILVFGERNGRFSEFQSKLDPLLKQHKTGIGSISICGYSSGGRAAFANYGHATKAVGLIDPNIKYEDFAKFDSKTVLSLNDSSPESWPWSAGDPNNSKYTIGQARHDAVALVKKAGGFSEIKSTGHGAYPGYFLKTFESKLI